MRAASAAVGARSRHALRKHPGSETQAPTPRPVPALVQEEIIRFPDDEPTPPTGWRRRIAAGIGLLFLLLIVGFLIWFVATHRARSEGDGTPFGIGRGTASLPVGEGSAGGGVGGWLGFADLGPAEGA
jgi:hypothetical protein